jgi:tetratricopeptide (TPR) repeat protein
MAWPASGRIRTRALAGIAALMVLGTVGLYAQVSGHEFLHYDDDQYVTDNPMVAGGLSWSGVAWAFTSSHASNWHPLTWLSHMLDVQLFGMDAGAHLLVNALLHAATAALLFLLLARTTGALGRSVFVAALFAVHPLHVESVAWVSERKDVLSTLFGVLMLHAYARHALRPSALRYTLVLACFGLSLLSKAMWVTAPFLLLLLDYWPLQRIEGSPLHPDPGHPEVPRRTLARLLVEKVPLLAMAAAASIAAMAAQVGGGAVNSLEQVGLGARAANAVVAYAAYLGKALWPASLSAIYPLVPGGPPAWQAAAAGVLLAAITALAVRFVVRMPWIGVGWAWFLGTLVPVIGIVQLGAEAMADRYTYFPLVGVFIAVAWTADRLVRDAAPPAMNALRAAAVIAVVVLAVSAVGQLRYWRNQESLFRQAVAVTGSGRAHHVLSQALLAAGKLEESLVHAREAARLDSADARAQKNLGFVLYRLGQVDEAIVALRRAVALQPDYAEAHANLAIAYGKKGWTDQAMQEMSLSMKLRAAGAGRVR